MIGIMSNEKTHYRKAFDSPYLSSADIVDPVALTIKCVTLEIDRTKKTKDAFNTAWFVERELRPGERLKPMIINATNSKFLAALTGSKWIDDWCNVPVTVMVDHNVRFGKETVEGLRIGRAADRPPELSEDDQNAAEDAALGGMASYQKYFAGVSNAVRVALKAGGSESVHERCKKAADEADKAAKAEQPTEGPA